MADKNVGQRRCERRRLIRVYSGLIYGGSKSRLDPPHALFKRFDPGDRAMDLLVAESVEFRAFHLFTLTFGVGVAIQDERLTA